jgi:hypothetical protein
VPIRVVPVSSKPNRIEEECRMRVVYFNEEITGTKARTLKKSWV